MFGPSGIAEMRRVKAIFDPSGLLNPGNLFSRQPACPPFRWRPLAKVAGQTVLRRGHTLQSVSVAFMPK
jgi:hypothetical protein